MQKPSINKDVLDIVLNVLNMNQHALNFTLTTMPKQNINRDILETKLDALGMN